ncbi:MAG: hypothetical protein OHK0015_43840 [Chloroflexi bacterium OHK40]
MPTPMHSNGAPAALQTEFEFTLPRGYVDAEGNLHRHGVMRLATAMDEIAPMRDQRVRNNQAYLVIILLSRVITRLGNLRDINTGVIESLFSADLAYLQDFYRRINETGSAAAEVVCPHCEGRFEIDMGQVGG